MKVRSINRGSPADRALAVRERPAIDLMGGRFAQIRRPHTDAAITLELTGIVGRRAPATSDTKACDATSHYSYANSWQVALIN